MIVRRKQVAAASVSIASLERPGLWHRLETWIGVLWSCFICVGAIALAVLLVIGAHHHRVPTGVLILAYVLVGLTVVVEVVYIGLLNDWGQAPVYPLGLAMPFIWPRLSAMLRWPLSVWWAGHFAASVYAGVQVVSVTGLFDELTWLTALAIVLLVALAIGAANAGNVFMMMAISSIIPSPDLLRRIWRYRWIVDALATLIAWLILVTF